jgi:hypothetical protein
MKQYGLSAAVATRVLAGVDRELRTLPRSVTNRPRRKPIPEPERNDCVPPPKRLAMSPTEAIKQTPVHATIGLIIAWLWFTSQIGHSLLIDLLIMWERLPK